MAHYLPEIGQPWIRTLNSLSKDPEFHSWLFHFSNLASPGFY